MALLSTLVALPLCALHVPHDDAHSVAIGPGPGGATSLVVACNASTHFLHSEDDGLSWRPLSAPGLERPSPTRVAHWPDPVDPRFFLATSGGVWTWHPRSGDVRAASAGLPASHANVVDLAAPANGRGSVFAATSTGRVYVWDEASLSWLLSLDAGYADAAAQLAVVRTWHSGPNGMLAVAGIAGQLHYTEDGGATWELHPQFPTAATGSHEWSITGLALGHDFATSGGVVLARARSTPADAGELWLSTDFGTTFTRTATLDERPRAVASAEPTGVDPAPWFVVMHDLPKPSQGPSGHGVLRSTDGGSTWSDEGNEQDFFLEAPADASVEPGLQPLYAITASPAFASDRTLYLARAEGLYRSRDAGDSWQQVRLRPETHVRELDTGLDADGGLVAFGGAYGSGLLRWSAASGAAEVLPRTKALFARPVSVSRSYGVDGAVAMGGSAGWSLWFDPAVPVANPYGVAEWVDEPFNVYGYVKTLALSPSFDASGLDPAGDQSLFFSVRNGTRPGANKTYVSTDAGRTVQVVDAIAGGGDAPHLEEIAFTPEFVALPFSRQGEVYGYFGRNLARLEGVAWRAIADVGAEIRSIAIDPAYEKPHRARVFVALGAPPYLGVVEDLPGGAVHTPIDAGALPGSIGELVAGLDERGAVQLYATTWGLGVWRVAPDDPFPVWTEVGSAFPDAFAEGLALSPLFAHDRTVVAGTQSGFAVLEDVPGAAWQHFPAPQVLDNELASVRFYAPNAPANPQPERIWRWPLVPGYVLRTTYGVRPVGANAVATSSDGALAVCEGRGSRVEVCTMRGPAVGTAVLSVYDWQSGALLATTSQDLHDAGGFGTTCFGVDLPPDSRFRAELEAQLDPGETLVFDAFLVRP